MKLPSRQAISGTLAAAILATCFTACNADTATLTANNTATPTDVPSLNSLVRDLTKELNAEGIPNNSEDDPANGPEANRPKTPSAPSNNNTYPPADVTATRTTLDSLVVKGRAPKTGYSRDQFGKAWADINGNNCPTRDDILLRDLTNVTLAENNCQVLSGLLNDPYTGKTIEFTRGRDTSMSIQIDHIVSLSDGWQKGAQQLTPERREQLANDPINLVAVDGPTNQKKRDGDAATWLPPNKSYRCNYVSKQVQVKSLYGLWITQAEKDAI